MKLTKILLAIIILFSIVFADKEVANHKVTFYSQDSLFKIVSIPEVAFLQNKGITKVFKNDTNLYQFNWYSDRIYPYSIGNAIYIVRFAQWHRGQVNKKAFEIGFYKNDKILKEYLVKDILTDTTKAFKSVSHYQVIREVKAFKRIFDNINMREKVSFIIITTEQKEIDFEIETGNIIETSKRL